jgi:hypothetical protein
MGGITNIVPILLETSGSRATLRRICLHFPSMYVHLSVTGHNLLGEALLRPFFWSCGGRDSGSSFLVLLGVDSEEGSFLFSPVSGYLTGGHGYIFLLTVVFCGQLFWDLFSVCFVLRPPARRSHGKYVTRGGEESGGGGRLPPSVIYFVEFIGSDELY